MSQVATDASVGTKIAEQPLKVMIAGAPAAGKGTQCQKIVDKVRDCQSLVNLIFSLRPISAPLA